MNHYEVIAHYAYGSRAVVVVAASADEAICKARPEIRKMIPVGYAITKIWATSAY